MILQTLVHFFTPNCCWKIIIYKHYLKGNPKCHTTRLYLVPDVTGLTLCQTKLGNTIIDPFGNIFLHCIQCFNSSRICGS